MKYRVFLLAMTITLIASPVMAQEQTPLPSHHPAAELELQKKEAERKKSELEKNAKIIQEELDDTKKSLVEIAGGAKKNEAELTALETKMGQNKIEQDEIHKRLKKDKSSIGGLVMALERLDKMPTEAILARPGAPLETAQSAMLLQSILPNIYGRAERLKKDLGRLDTILKEMEQDRAKVKAASQELSGKQKEIAGLLAKRKGLYDQNQTELKGQETALREIADKSKNLQDLVARIAERERAAREEETARTASMLREERPIATAALRATPLPKTGSAQLPVSGLIRVGYKQFDDIGAESQGLTIEGRPQGLVVSPMGGVVRYAGVFKGYGNIIIVEHQKDYHSLIAGLARIDTVVGQSVAAGEPVGVLPKTDSDGGKPTLYYELRLHGEPVDPGRKFAGL